MRKFLLFLFFLMPLSAYAAKITVDVTPPTKNTDSSPLIDLASIIVEWGTCNGSTFVTAQSKVVVPTTNTTNIVTTTINPTGINPVCIRAYATNSAGVVSEPTSTLSYTLPGPLTSPVKLDKPIILPNQ